MPRKDHEQSSKATRPVLEEDEVRAGIQTTKLLCRYRREFDALVAVHERAEVLDAIAQLRTRPWHPIPRDDASQLENALILLAGRNFLAVGPVDPTNPEDGLDARLLAPATRDSIVAQIHPDIPDLDVYLGPGNWKRVWIDADASRNSIMNALKGMGIGGGGSVRNEWDNTWGPGNGFRYRILRRSGVSREQAYGRAFGSTPFRASSFYGCMEKTMAAARRYWSWRLNQEEYERQAQDGPNR